MSDCAESTKACSTDPGPPDPRCVERHPELKYRCVHFAGHGPAGEVRHHFSVRGADGNVVSGGWDHPPAPIQLIDFTPRTA